MAALSGGSVPICMEADEVAKAMAPSKAWPYAGSEDGWVKAHDALRADMKDLAAALKLLAGAGSYNAWQVRGAAPPSHSFRLCRLAPPRVQTALQR